MNIKFDNENCNIKNLALKFLQNSRRHPVLSYIVIKKVSLIKYTQLKECIKHFNNLPPSLNHN